MCIRDRVSKTPKDINCESCRWHSTSKLDSDFRKEVCSAFWKLDYCHQKNFTKNNVSSKPTKTKRIRTRTGINKSVFFFFKNLMKESVCKNC